MKARRAGSVLAALLWLAGCATPHEARLYDYNSGLLSSVQLFGLEQLHGRATAQLFGGETMTGEYTVTGEITTPSDLPRRKQLEFDATLAARRQDEAHRPMLDRATATLTQVFGFKPDAAARPMAVVTLVGDRGTVLEIVFYTLDVKEGVGSGVARDNRGNWYIVRLGEA